MLLSPFRMLLSPCRARSMPQDNYAYTGPTRGTADELRAAIHGNPSNWVGSNTASTVGPTGFTVLPPPPPPPPGALLSGSCSASHTQADGWQGVCCLANSCAHRATFPTLCEERRCCAPAGAAKAASLDTCCAT